MHRMGHIADRLGGVVEGRMTGTEEHADGLAARTVATEHTAHDEEFLVPWAFGEWSG